MERASPNLKLNEWYMDDGLLVATEVDPLLKAYTKLVQEGPNHGLFLNNGKCHLWSTAQNVQWEGFPEDIVRDGQDGMEVLGSGIGYAGIAKKMAAKRVAKVKDIMDNLPSLHDSVMQYHLLRDCVGYPKFNFTLRTTNPSFITEEIQSFDHNIKTALSDLFGNYILSPADYTRVSLPIKLSGFGFVFASVEAPSAYLGSVSQSSELQCNILSHLNEAATYKRLQQHKISHLYSRLCDNNAIQQPPELRKFLKSDKPQNFLSSLVTQARFNLLLNSTENNVEKRLIKACTLPSSGAWLDHHSSNNREYMSSMEWTIAAKFRLGAPLFSHQVQCPHCVDGSLDVFGRHASFCPGSNDCANRHNAIRECLISLALQAQLVVDKEPTHLLLDGSSQRPADIFLPSHENGQPLAIDVSGVDLLDPHSGGSNDSKELLATREASKHQKYDGQCATVGITFKTFIFGSLGGFGEEATVFIKELGRRVARVNATLASDEIAKIRRLLSHIIQQRQANACIRRGETADVLVY
jgi:hypothetical protein